MASVTVRHREFTGPERIKKLAIQETKHSIAIAGLKQRHVVEAQSDWHAKHGTPDRRVYKKYEEQRY